MLISARRFMLGGAAVAAAALAGAIALAQTPSPPGATVYFINLKDGDTVMSPFKVQFGLTGTIDYSLWANVISRVEVRWDHSLSADRPYGGTSDDPGGLKNVVTLALNVIYSF